MPVCVCVSAAGCKLQGTMGITKQTTEAVVFLFYPIKEQEMTGRMAEGCLINQAEGQRSCVMSVV